MCSSWCTAALIFAISSIAFSLRSCSSDAVGSLVSALNTQQRQQYSSITGSRRNIYLAGLCLGTVLAGLFVWLRTRDGQPLMSSLSACQFVVVLEVCIYMYYMLAPKPELFVVTLASERLREKWATAYRSMQLRHYASFAFAIAAVGAASMVTCK